MEFSGLGKHRSDCVSFRYEDSIHAGCFWPRPDAEVSSQRAQVEVRWNRKIAAKVGYGTCVKDISGAATVKSWIECARIEGQFGCCSETKLADILIEPSQVEVYQSSPRTPVTLAKSFQVALSLLIFGCTGIKLSPHVALHDGIF